MNKIILLLLIVAATVTSCRKEDKSSVRTDKPIAEGMVGVWLTTSEIHEYYNSSNEKVFTKTVEPGWKYTLKDLLTLTNPQGQRQFQTAYSITSSNGKNFLSFTNDGVTETFEITSLEQKTMSLHQQKTNVTYNDNGEKTAAKVISSFNFHCPCK